MDLSQPGNLTRASTVRAVVEGPTGTSGGWGSIHHRDIRTQNEKHVEDAADQSKMDGAHQNRARGSPTFEF